MRGINAQPRFLIIPRDSTKISLTKNFRNPDCLKTIIFGIRDIKRKTDDERKSCWSCPLWIILLSHRVLETAWKNITGLGDWKFLSLTKTNVAYLRRWQPISAGLLEDKQVATIPNLFSTVYLKLEFIFAPLGKYLFLNAGANVRSSQARGTLSLSGLIFNNQFFQHLDRDGWTRKFLKFANVRAGYFFFCEVASKSIGWEAKISGHSLYSGFFRTLCIVAFYGLCPALHSGISLDIN